MRRVSPDWGGGRDPAIRFESGHGQVADGVRMPLRHENSFNDSDMINGLKGVLPRRSNSWPALASYGAAMFGSTYKTCGIDDGPAVGTASGKVAI